MTLADVLAQMRAVAVPIGQRTMSMYDLVRESVLALDSAVTDLSVRCDYDAEVLCDALGLYVDDEFVDENDEDAVTQMFGTTIAEFTTDLRAALDIFRSP